uniref:Uncharacterized protein n=1 Tax=viral metagenome TaxID=1070528 RepID=A0A6M3LCJ4_9ZZZZ
MNVRKLIAELKKMPKDLEVHINHHDNVAWESAGIVSYVYRFTKENFVDDVEKRYDADSKRMFADMPDECIILNC